MSRKTWIDATIEAAREADIRMPWSRKPEPQPIPVPVAVQATR